MNPSIASFLSLTGIGYLDGVTFDRDRYIARLTLLPKHRVSDRPQDEITLHCLVDQKERQHLLDALDWKRQNGHAVLLRFVAQYDKLGCSFPGLTDDDPEQLVSIDARLMQLSDAYVDGQRMESLS